MNPKTPKNKRMVYIYDENLEFYDKIANKSEMINEMLFDKQRRARPDTNLDYVKSKVAEMDARAKGE